MRDRTIRLRWCGLPTARTLVRCGVAAALVVAGSRATQDAAANGDSRSLTIYHTHTKETATITFRRNGRYDSEALQQLNWILRDWRLDEPIKMDPRLFDIVWQAYREVGSGAPIHVVSAYRSPGTNAMLRRRSRAVSEHSQHMAGKAMDFYLPDVPMDRVRAIAMRLQEGGVGFYPSAHNPFVHLDAGSVRSWPRMPHGQLARLFPDGKTVHIPADGKPMARYEEARAEILSRGGAVAGAYAEGGPPEPGEGGRRRSLWASLFGGGEDEDAEFYKSSQGGGRFASRPSRGTAYAMNTSGGEDAGTRGTLAYAPAPVPAAPAPSGQPGQNFFARALGLNQPAPVPAPAAPVEEGSADDSLQAEAPMPPARPSDIAALTSLTDVPLPPVRPVSFAALDNATSLNPALANPTVGVTEPSGPLPSHPLPPSRLAFAGAGPAAVAPHADTGAARMVTPGPAPATSNADRAALQSLFDQATSGSPSAAAKVLTAKAQARPLASDARVAAPNANIRMSFSRGETELSTGRFSGPAVKPLPVLR